MSDRKESTWKHAPLWGAVLGAAHAMLKNMIVRYIRKRDLTLRWSDVASTAVVGFIGYLTLRHQHGRELGG